MEKTIFIEFNGKPLIVEDIQGIAFEIKDYDISKYVRETTKEKTYNPFEKSITFDIPFYSNDFTIFGTYEGCKNIISHDNSVVFMFRNKTLHC